MMKTYDSYKDSGIEWIGEIPRHWEVLRLKNVGSIKSGDNLESTNINESGLYPVYGGNGILGYHSDFNSIESVLCIGRVGEKCGNVHRVDSKCWINDNSLIFKYDSSKVVIDYLFYTITIRDLNLIRNQNTQPLITGSSVKNEYIPFPDLITQNIITHYLDEKTSLIDEMVEKKKRKIELLKEYRTSLINTVVTKGLNPDVPMKDSGIEWIGEIPRHWGLKRLKYVCNVRTGSRDTQDRVEDGLYPFFVRSPIVEKINSYSYDGEGVLTVGDGVGTGKVFHYFNGKFEYHQRVYLFSNFSGILGRYFYDYMKVKFINVTEDQNSKSTVDSLRRPLIDNFTFVLPPLSEQNQIVEYLDEKTREIDKTIELENKKIELLKEYRQSLISNVVTGKIKVVSE